VKVGLFVVVNVNNEHYKELSSSKDMEVTVI